jgi:DNA topoisomerase VI subunit B
VTSAELGRDFDGDMTVSELTPKQVRFDWCCLGLHPCVHDHGSGGCVSQIHQIVALFRVAKFPAPRGDCLSPAGEYNLRLGIMKVD